MADSASVSRDRRPDEADETEAMSRTELRLGLPTGSWLGDVSRTVPSSVIRVEEALTVDDATVTVVVVAGTDRGRVVDALCGHDRVDDATTVERRGDGRTVRVAGRPPAYLPAARDVGLPVASPVEVTDGSATVTVAGERDRIEALGRRLTADGVTVGIAATDAGTADRTLTDAQRELVFEAVSAGYYDTPRRCTLTELAAAHGIAKSTCSETLHRAEGRILRRFVDGGFSPSPAGDADRREHSTSDESTVDAAVSGTGENVGDVNTSGSASDADASGSAGDGAVASAPTE